MAVKLSLILPMYNVECYIEETLESIYSQIVSSEVEVVLVNDGSPDHSAEVAESWLQNNTNLQNWRIIHQENKGLGGARNTGIEQAAGAYIWCIDTDDWLINNGIRRILKIINEETPDAIAICASDKFANGMVQQRFNFMGAPVVTTGLEMLRNGKFSHCVPFTIYRRSYLASMGLRFQEHLFHEDSEFTPRAYWGLQTLRLVNDCYYLVRHNPNSITRTPNFKRSFDLLTVANSLHSFYTLHKQNKASKVFHPIISSVLNSSLANSIHLPIEMMNAFKLEIQGKGYVFRHFYKSKSWKYIVEGVLFQIFAFNRLWCYHNILKKLN